MASGQGRWHLGGFIVQGSVRIRGGGLLFMGEGQRASRGSVRGAGGRAQTHPLPPRKLKQREQTQKYEEVNIYIYICVWIDTRLEP